MKTAVTVIDTVQTGIDNYKDVRSTKVFDDNSTLLDIKLWIRGNKNFPIDKISLASVDISDVPE